MSRSTPKNSEYDGFVFFASTLGVMLGIVYCVSRVGLPDLHLREVFCAVGLLLFVLNISLLQMALTKGKKHVWDYQTIPLVVLALVLVSHLFSSLNQAALLIPIVGYCLCGYRLILGSRRFSLPVVSLVILSAVLISFLCAFLTWGRGYLTPVFMEGLLNGTVTDDPIFHISRSAIFSTYGVPTNGVHGLMYFPYHFGSHILLGGLATLIGLQPFQAYAIVFPIVFFPLLFHGVLVLAHEVRKLQTKSSRTPPNNLIWVFLPIVFIGVLPPVVQGLITPTGVFGSESFIVSFVFATYLASFFLNHLKGNPNLEFGGLPNLITIGVVFPFLVGVVGLCKLSIMLVLLAGTGYYFLRNRKFTKGWFLFLGLCSVVSMLVFASVYNPAWGSGMQLTIFAWIREHIPEGWKFTYWTLAYMWLWIYVFVILQRAKISSFKMLVKFIKRKKLVSLEVLFVMFVVGELPGFVGTGPGGAAGYFSAVTRFVGLIMFLSVLPSWKSIADLSFAKKFVILVIGLCSLTLLNNLTSLAKPFIRSNLQARGIKRGSKEEARLKRAISELRLSAAISDTREPAAMNKAQNNLMSVLLGLSKMDPSEKERTGIYVPKSNRTFWEYFGTDRFARRKPSFLMPSMTGMVLLAGYPEIRNDLDSFQYYYDLSQTKALELSQTDQTLGTLCTLGKKWGLDQVIVLVEERRGVVAPQINNCADSAEEALL